MAPSSSRFPTARERPLTPSSCSPRWGMAEALAETFLQWVNMVASAPLGEPADGRQSRRIDWVSLLMALGIVMIVGGAAWLRFAPPSSIEPPAVGSVLPPLRLLDL